jgi:pimeloyl-ACP methyl ester carboxylesterase
LVVGLKGQMATKKHTSSQNKLIIPVAGAGNIKVHPHLPHIKVFSSATVHFGQLRHGFESQEWAVEEPIVLPHLGLAGLASAHVAVEKLIDHKLAKHPGKKAVLIGHSMGGLFVARYVADRRNEEQVAGGITVDSPHEPDFTGAFRGPANLMMRAVVDRGTSFTHETRRRTTTNHTEGDSARLILVGNMSSNLIGASGALPNYVGAERHLLSSHHGAEPIGVKFVDAPDVDHIDMLFNPQVISFVIGSASLLVGRHELAGTSQLAFTG